MRWSHAVVQIPETCDWQLQRGVDPSRGWAGLIFRQFSSTGRCRLRQRLTQLAQWEVSLNINRKRCVFIAASDLVGTQTHWRGCQLWAAPSVRVTHQSDLRRSLHTLLFLMLSVHLGFLWCDSEAKEQQCARKLRCVKVCCVRLHYVPGGPSLTPDRAEFFITVLNTRTIFYNTTWRSLPSWELLTGVSSEIKYFKRSSVRVFSLAAY